MIIISTSSFVLIACTLVLNVLLTIALTKLILLHSLKNNISDDPKSDASRKFQKQPVLLLGGTALCLSSTIVMLILKFIIDNYQIFNDLKGNASGLSYLSLAAFMLSVVIMIIGGYLDDRYKMSSKYQLVFILLSITLFTLISGIRFDPFYIGFGSMFSLVATIAWLGFCTASTKFLDGHDGLVVSVGLINFLTIACVALLDYINQPIVAVFAIIWAVGLFAFGVYNFPNARAYLGEGASEIIGFSIGVLSILSGAKIATTIAILGWFILDILLVWIIRIMEGRNPLTSADRNHWHFRLVDAGFNKLQVLIITWTILLISSLISVYGDAKLKIIFFVVQIFILLAIFGFTSSQNKLKGKAKLK